MALNFMKNAIDAWLVRLETEMLVYDTDTKGLALRVTKAGGKTFVVVRKIQGKDKRTKTACFDKRTSKIPVIREATLKHDANYQAELEKIVLGATRTDVTLSLAFENICCEA